MCFSNADSLVGCRAKGYRTVFKDLALIREPNGDIVLSSSIYRNVWWSASSGTHIAKKIKLRPKKTLVNLEIDGEFVKKEGIEIEEGYHAYTHYSLVSTQLHELKEKIDKVILGSRHNVPIYNCFFSIPPNTRYFISLEHGECVSELLTFIGTTIVTKVAKSEILHTKVNLIRIIYNSIRENFEKMKMTDEVREKISMRLKLIDNCCVSS